MNRTKPKLIYQRPILSDSLEQKISDAIQAYEHRGKWKEWGLDKLREQGVAILLHGPPGTGKTMTAHYISKRLHLGIRQVSIADYGSQVPGQLARNIRTIFLGEVTAAKQEKHHEPIIFLDECDSMLVSRNRLGHDMMWMLEPISALLTHIAEYPGLVILSTNMLKLLDEALERRVLAKIEFPKPEENIRRKIWVSKWPKQFPIQPSREELDMLAKHELTGAEIENVFLLWAGRLIQQMPDVRYSINSLIDIIGERLGIFAIYLDGNEDHELRGQLATVN
jgi:SpoVK/Ycf46/Vps4 family AAA+-type ATPase